VHQSGPALDAGPVPGVTVVIPSYRSARTIEPVLTALVAQRTAIVFRVAVLHSGDEPLPAGIVERFPSVSFVVFGDRLRPGVKRNWGARRARSRWLLFVDADCVAEPDLLDALVHEAAREGAVGAGGTVEIAEPWTIASWTMHLLEFGDWLAGHASGVSRDFPSCNALYDRDAFLAAGGFPEDVYPCEDTVLNQRLVAAGHHLIFVAAATVRHIHVRTVREVIAYNRQFGQMYGRVSRTYGMAGGNLAGVLAAVPAVAAVRYARMVGRVVRYRPRRELITLVMSAPLAAVAAVAWAIGFARPGGAQAG
jgi:GT2 family glycosyltransferase